MYYNIPMLMKPFVLLLMLVAGCAASHTATKPNADGTYTVTFTRSSWCTDTDRSISIDGRTYRIGDTEPTFTVEVSPGVYTFEYSVGSQIRKRWFNKEVTKTMTLELPCSHVWDTQKERRHN